MNQIVCAAAVFALHFLVFLGFGCLCLRLCGQTQLRIGDALISGYFCYFFLFELCCIPAQLGGLKTGTLGLGMSLLCAAALIASAVLWLRERKRSGVRVSPQRTLLQRHGLMLAVVMAVVLYQLIAVILYTDNSADAAYYVAEATVSAFRNRLGRYDTDTGQKLSSFNIRYVFSAFPMHNAVIARMSGLAAIIQARTVMPAVNVIIANLIYYRLGTALFGQRDEQAGDLFVCLMCLINMYAGTIYLPGTFLFTRLYEGKSMIANIVLPAVLCCGLRLWKDERDKMAWLGLFLAGGAAVCFAGTGLLASVAAFAVLVPVMLRSRKCSTAALAVLSVMPAVVWFALYMAAGAGYINLSIK